MRKGYIPLTRTQTEKMTARRRVAEQYRRKSTSTRKAK